MSTPARITAFAVGLLVVFAVAIGVGRAAGPLDDDADEAHESMGGEDGEHSGGHGKTAAAEETGAVGLQASEAGYTLSLVEDRLPSGRQRVAFLVLGPDGAPVTAYDEQHEKDLHLIVLRRDLTDFQHVHPTLDDTGTWSVPVDLRPGAWRVIADFKPAGADALVLGTDLLVPGGFAPEELGGDSVRTAVDGYDVGLAGSYVAGQDVELTATVRRSGQPVTDLEPYLGAYGHLVALRDGDLGYLHVHPEEGEPGPTISFHTRFPSAGRYRLFLDFQHGGAVHTAAFTVTVTDGESHATSEGADEGTEEGGHGH
jgi:hypothetical protein